MTNTIIGAPVTARDVTAALNALGIGDLTTVARVVIDPHGVTVTRHRLNQDGKKYLDGDDVATEETTLTIDWSVQS